jgi:hypothetical protein
MHSSDAQATTLTSSGPIFAGPGRVAQILYVGGLSAGSIKVRDGGASGTILLDMATTNSGAKQCDFSRTPFYCKASVYVELSNITSCTVIYT